MIVFFSYDFLGLNLLNLVRFDDKFNLDEKKNRSKRGSRNITSTL